TRFPLESRLKSDPLVRSDRVTDMDCIVAKRRNVDKEHLPEVRACPTRAFVASFNERHPAENSQCPALKPSKRKSNGCSSPFPFAHLCWLSKTMTWCRSNIRRTSPSS